VITLPELDIFVLGSMGMQVVLTAALHPPLLALLFPPWLWVFLVRNDFFAKRTLERRPALSLAAHLAFFPLVALYAVAADQLPVTGALSPGLIAFLLLSVLCAAAIEFARKSLAPESERAGVVTYSRLWGPSRAGMTTAFTLVTALVCALLAFLATRASGWWFLPAAAVGFTGFLCAAHYAERPTREHSARLLIATACWIAVAYASVGILPLIVRHSGDITP
jgi:4-hydroxybenzoate polyprenyltransferase